jgi:hypothetical protein
LDGGVESGGTEVGGKAANEKHASGVKTPFGEAVLLPGIKFHPSDEDLSPGTPEHPAYQFLVVGHVILSDGQ